MRLSAEHMWYVEQSLCCVPEPECCSSNLPHFCLFCASRPDADRVKMNGLTEGPHVRHLIKTVKKDGKTTEQVPPVNQKKGKPLMEKGAVGSPMPAQLYRAKWGGSRACCIDAYANSACRGKIKLLQSLTKAARIRVQAISPEAHHRRPNHQA